MIKTYTIALLLPLITLYILGRFNNVKYKPLNVIRDLGYRFEGEGVQPPNTQV